jgi:hypothetical protein
MAVYFDQNGNLVDTEINESSNVFMEDPTENFYQPRMDISPTQDFYEPSIFPPTSYGFINAPQSYYEPRMDISPTQDFYQPREFVNAPQNYYQPDLTTLRGLDMNRFQGVSDMSVIDETTNDEQDQNYIDQVNKNKSTGIMDLIMGIAVPGYGFLKNVGSNFKQNPRATGIRNFYSPEGLTSTGSIASGIMKGYNPVSGGFLNMITGGKFGKPTNYGLAGAMQRRIENIKGRKMPQTDASRAKISELRNLQLAEMQDRSDRGESMGSIGRSTFSGPGMAFEKQSGGVSGKGTANERNYGGR